jgi:hypothetical protein
MGTSFHAQLIHHKNKEEQAGTTQMLKKTNPQKYLLLLRCTKAMPPSSLIYASLHP